MDLEEDPTKNFLLHKLEEIKSTKESLKHELQTRRDLLKLSEQRVTELVGTLQVEDTWKRTFNSKCIFGIVVKNTESQPVDFSELVLNLNSSNPITYAVKLFRKCDEQDSNYLIGEWVCVDSIRNSAIALIVLDKPVFLKQTAYDLEGFINCSKESRQFKVALPKLNVSAGDFTDSAFDVQRLKLVQGVDEEFLSYMVAHEETDFVGSLSMDVRRKLDSFLAIDCMFRKAEVNSSKKYFVVDGISSGIDGCLIELEDTSDDALFYFRMLTRDHEQVKQLLHYLHKNVGGISILPRSRDVHLLKCGPFIYQSFLDREDVCGKGDSFQKILLQEINFIEDFCATKVQNNECVGKDYARFRRDLNGLEFNTDTERIKYEVLL